MAIDFDFIINVTAVVTRVLAWGFLIFLVYRVYKKQTVRPKVWKVLIIMFVGLFSFSIKWNMFDTMLKIPILPLGVWILYFFLRRKDKRWQAYRFFAWLGFWSNFLFLSSTLIAIPIHHVIYPKDEPSTYISNVEDAYIMNIHPSASDRSLNKKSLLKQLDTLKQEMIISDEWYEDTYINSESNQRNERFPYLLAGASSKWGSGLHTIVYIENDGKGILISTPQEQLYFRSEDSLIEGVE